MPVGNDIAKRFEQLETQWLSFQKKAATKRDETATPSGSTPHLLTSSHERLEESELASKTCGSTFTFPVPDHQACLETDRTSCYRGGGKATKVRAKSSALSTRLSNSLRNRTFSEGERSPRPSHSSSSQAEAGRTTRGTPGSTVSGQGARDAPATSPGDGKGERGTVSFVGERTLNSVCSSLPRASLADQHRSKASIAQRKCSGNGGRRAEPCGSPAGACAADPTGAGKYLHGYSAGCNGRKPCTPHFSVAEYRSHVDVKRYLSGDVCTSTPAGSDPATYSSGKGPPQGTDCLPNFLDCHDSPKVVCSPQVEDPNSEKDVQCRVGGSFEANSKPIEHARNASSWDTLGCLAAEDDDQDFEGIEDAMISDVQEIEQFAKPRSLGEPQTHFRHWLRSEKCYATEEQSRKKARQKQEKKDAGASVKALETGKMVLRKLLSCLKDVLQEFEHKDQSLQHSWRNLAQSRKLSLDTQSYGSACGTGSMHLDDLWLLAEEANPENWSRPIIGICERLVSLFGRETHLQRWALALERETVNLMRMEEETAEMKAAAAKEVERVSTLEREVQEKSRNIEEERLNLAKERETLSLWVGHLQERRKAVSECEKEAAASLAEVQKRSANLFVRESAIDGRALEIATLQEEVRVVSQRLHDDLEVLTKEKLRIQEKLRQILAKEGDVETQAKVLSKMQQDLQTQTKQMERERLLGNEENQKTCALLREREEKLTSRENMLQSLQTQVEEARVEAEDVKRNAENSRAAIWKDRQEVDEYITSAGTRLRDWEEELTSRENKLLERQERVNELEKRVADKQESYQLLHQKVLEEQQIMSDELDQRELTLAKRTAMQDQKLAHVTNELHKLRDERDRVRKDTQVLSELEARICAVSKTLQARHEELLHQVREDVKQFGERMEELESMKWSLKSESIRTFEELSVHKQALRVWQNELEGSLEEQIKNMVKDKTDLEAHVQRLNTMQLGMERVGFEVIEHIQVLEKTASKLDQRQQRVELAHSSIKESAVKLMLQQDCLLQREASLHAKESNLREAQNQLKQLAVDAQAHELALNEKEQALRMGENNLQVMEGKLEEERRSFEERVLKFKQHVADLEKEAANTEETFRSQAEALAQKERALAMERLATLKGVAGDSRELFRGSNEGLSMRGGERQALEEKIKIVEGSNSESWKGSKDDQGRGVALKQAGYLARAQMTCCAKQQLEPRFGNSFNADELTAQRLSSDSYCQHNESADTTLQAIRDSFHAASSAGEKLATGDGDSSITGTDQRGKDIREFWQHLRSSGLRTELDRIGAERKQAIEGLLTSLAKTDTGRGTVTALLDPMVTQEKVEPKDFDRSPFSAGVALDPCRKVDKERADVVKETDCTHVDSAGEATDIGQDHKQLKGKQDQELGFSSTGNFLSNFAKQFSRDSSGIIQMSSRCGTGSISEHHPGEAADRGRPALTSTGHCGVRETASKQNKTVAVGTGGQHGGTERSPETTHENFNEASEDTLKQGICSRDVTVHSKFAGWRESYGKESSMKLRSLQHKTTLGTSSINCVPQRHRSCSQRLDNQAGSGGTIDVGLAGVNAENMYAAALPQLNVSNRTGEMSAIVSDVPELPSSFFAESKFSSQQQLEAVMTALHQASQESRSQLLTAKHLAQRLPSSVASASQVHAALEGLSSKLTLMEQIEDGLASQLEKLSSESPYAVDQAYVDRVQLLNRMEEQQRLRLEWEEDMQQHMDSIQSVLHGATCYSTPQRLASSLNRSQLQTPSSASSYRPVLWQNFGSPGSAHKLLDSVGQRSVHTSGSYGILEQLRPSLLQTNAASVRAEDDNVETAYSLGYPGGGATGLKSLAMSSRRKLVMSPVQRMSGLFTS